MNHKVLLADDSLTIQKVIKITLANQPYDITDCSNEEELFRQLPIVKPKLVFLDFNLSDKYTGYELTTKIKSILPTTKVLLLLGTFDSVDDDTMEKCGASDKIVKPFDSNKFIAICKQMIETFADDDMGEIAYPEAKVKEAFPEDEDSQWTMSHSTAQNLPKFEEEKLDNSFPEIQNPLHKEMSDWGMSVPSIIGKEEVSSAMPDLPPVIGGDLPKATEPVAAAPKRFEPKFPDNTDLDYPTIEEINEVRSESNSKLVSIETFKDVPLELETHYIPDESDVSNIEAQIRDEVEDNLWNADEFENLKQEITSKIEEAKSEYRPKADDFDDSLFNPIQEDDLAFEVTKDLQETAQAIDRAEIESMVKKYVKEYMDEMFKKQVEKISWEVIPDLAENLIRQELSKISNKIIND